MKTLLTGANGFVGSRIMAAYADGKSGDIVAAPSLRGASREDVERLIDRVQPDVIIHTAAISDIGACEANPEASYAANVLIPTYLAHAARGARLLMFSSDQVYSGCGSEGPFGEATVCGANTYARHKIEMEQRVLDIAPGAVLLRATWMYDMPLYGASNRGNFLVNMLCAAIAHKPMAFSRMEHRGMTYVREVAELVRESIRLPGGAYNFGSENTLTMYETARYLTDLLGLKIEIQPTENRRSLWMDCGKLRQNGIAFRSTADGLAACVEDYGLKLLCGAER